MNDWFENFSKQYLEYENHHNYDYSRMLRPYKDINSVEITGNVLSGHISHGKHDFNHVKITFKEFTDNQKDKLRKIVDENPINTFKVINKTLPDDMLDAGIKILPESLDEMDIECSYDDKKDNIIDTLSLLKEFNRRLEKNKFLIFKIRGLDLSRKITYPLKTLDDILDLKFKPTGDDATLSNLYDANMTLIKNVEYPTKSFNFIYDDLFELLNNEINSLSQKGNTPKAFIDYNNNTNTSIKSKKGKNDYFPENRNEKKVMKFDIDEDYTLRGIGKINTDEKLFIFLNQAEHEELDERTAYLIQLVTLTYRLINHNAIMPEIFTTKNTYQIRWIPSFYDSNVINYCKKYYDSCPDDLVTLNGQRLSKENQVIIIVSLITNGLISYAIRKNQVTSFENISNTGFKLFTANKLKFENKYENTVENIQRQLSVFYMNELEYSYAMFIDDNLDIEIKIRKNDSYKSINEADVDQLKNLKRIYDLFSQHKIKNTLYEKITMSNKDFLIFREDIMKLLPYVNVELHNPFKIIDSKLELILDINLDKSTFQLDRISDNYLWKIGLNDTQLELERFDEITDDHNEMIKVDDKIYIVPGPTFRRLKGNMWLLKQKENSDEILHYAILEEYYDMKIKLSDNFRKLIKTSRLYEVPQSLNATLRPYQKIGYSWLIQNIKSGFGSILADDMGLGKTVQVLAAILYFKERNPVETRQSLIVVPPTLLSNWQQEIEKFTPELSYHIYHGPNRKFPSQRCDIILTSYSMIRQDIDHFLNETWFIYVIDEAQNIKNPSTKQTHAIKELPAFNKIAITGTPVENSPLDVYMPLRWLGYEDRTFDKFKYYYCKFGGYENKEITGYKHLEEITSLLNTMMLRRIKDDVLDLPEKLFVDEYVEMGNKQASVYNAERKTLIKNINDIKSSLNPLTRFIRARQATGYPGIISDVKSSAKFDRMEEITEDAVSNNKKVVIFSNWTQIVNPAYERLIKRYKGFKVTRKTKNRFNLIKSFQDNDDYNFIIGTIGAMGYGFNINAADIVIFLDEPSNKEKKNQAIDRCHRIGKNKNLTVYTLICQNTVDERIHNLVEQRGEMSNILLDTASDIDKTTLVNYLLS
jgi:SNF2 family DNA or RNA helicase